MQYIYGKILNKNDLYYEKMPWFKTPKHKKLSERIDMNLSNENILKYKGILILIMQAKQRDIEIIKRNLKHTFEK